MGGGASRAREDVSGLLYRTAGQCALRPLLGLVYRVEVAGAQRVPTRGPAILVANHESMLDPFVLGLVTRRTIRYMAKAELWRSPLTRAFMEGFGTFPVDRGRDGRLALRHAEELLARGELVGLFPQGTCAPLRHRPFRRGAARLALVAGAPLVPVALVGTERALRPGDAPVIGFPKLRILVGRPREVARERPTLAAARELTTWLEEAIAELRRPYGEPAHAWMD